MEIEAKVKRRGGAIDRMPHLFASFVNGWHAIKRDCWRAVFDLELAMPGMASISFVGHLARPVLAPLALRSEPMPPQARFAIGGGLKALVLLLLWRILRR